MSTGSISLDILLNQILSDSLSGGDASVKAIQRKFPSLTEKEARDIFSMVSAAADVDDAAARLVAIASRFVHNPPRSLAVVVGVHGIAHRRNDGVYVLPVAALKA